MRYPIVELSFKFPLLADVGAMHLMNAKTSALGDGALGDLHAAARKTQNDTQRENWQFATKRDVAITV